MRGIEKFKVCIDRDECIGDGACVHEAPESFELDDEHKAILLDDSTEDEEAILDAARSCPLDIIYLTDPKTGEQVYPND